MYPLPQWGLNENKEKTYFISCFIYYFIMMHRIQCVLWRCGGWWWLAGGKFIYFKVKLLWLSHQITGGREEMISTLKLFFLFFIREQVNDKVYYFILFFFLLNKQFCFSYFFSIFLTQEMKVNLYVHTYIYKSTNKIYFVQLKSMKSLKLLN